MTRWVSIGKIGEPYAEKTRELLRRMGPYSTRKFGEEIRFGLRLSTFQDKPMLYRSKWSSSPNTKIGIDFSQFLPEPALGEMDRLIIPDQKLLELYSKLEKYKGVDRFERVQRIVFYSSMVKLSGILEKFLLPSFFRWYPEGEWLFATANRDFHIALAVLRLLGGAMGLVDRDYDQLQSLGSFKTMREAQPGGLFYGSKYLSIPLMIFLPVMYGFVASKLNLSFLFLFDQPIEEVREFFPRSGLEFFRADSATLFKQEIDIEVEGITPSVADTFRLVQFDFMKKEIKQFIGNYYNLLNSFLAYIIDPANFVGKDGCSWSGLDHYRTWLSFERLTDEIIFLLTEDTPYLRKLATFRVLDQIASLMTEDSKQQSMNFRKLLLPSGDDPIAIGVKKYNGSVGQCIRNLLKTTREDLQNMVLDSIYIPGVYNPDTQIVKLPNGNTVRAYDYVTGVVRELRNSYHGYHTHQFDKYLLINTGSTPDSLPAIAVFAYLGLIARPDLFLTRSWQE